LKDLTEILPVTSAIFPARFIAIFNKINS